MRKIIFFVIMMAVFCCSSSTVEKCFEQNEIVPDILLVAPKKNMNVSLQNIYFVLNNRRWVFFELFYEGIISEWGDRQFGQWVDTNASQGQAASNLECRKRYLLHFGDDRSRRNFTCKPRSARNTPLAGDEHSGMLNRIWRWSDWVHWQWPAERNGLSSIRVFGL